jgi:hypothetical protein
MISFLLFFFWYPAVTFASQFVTGPDCEWTYILYSPTMPPNPTGTLEVTADLVYTGASCSSLVTGDFTFIFADVGYSATPLTWTLQPFTAAPNTTSAVTFQYPQLPSSSLSALEGTSSSYVLVRSVEMGLMWSDWIHHGVHWTG